MTDEPQDDRAQDDRQQADQLLEQREQEMSAFEKLVAIDCSRHVEKKGKFSYLSWPFAVRMLRENAPDATWTTVRHDGLPYQKTDFGVFVEVAVTVEGITLSQIHPVLNAQNKPIASPNAFDINTSIQRCLVKAMALHGLGLYIYAGEDLPNPTTEPDTTPDPGPDPSRPNTATQVTIDAFEAMSDEMKDFISSHAKEVCKLHDAEGDMVGYVAKQEFDTESQLALWSLLPSNVRSAYKKAKKHLTPADYASQA